MRPIRLFGAALFVLAPIGVMVHVHAGSAEDGKPAFHPVIPKTWDDAAMATLEVPLADPIGSPKHVSADYYYKIPVRPIYKSYAVYAPGHERPGYMDWLKRQEPQIIWDDADHRPALQTEADWIRAGEIVFGAPISYDFPAGVMQVRDPAWYQKTRTPVARDGTMPFSRYLCGQGKRTCRGG